MRNFTRSLPSALLVILAWAASTNATAANMVRLTLDTRIECTGIHEACGETFSSSEIIALEPQHVGKIHILVTRIWACAGSGGFVEEPKSGVAKVGARLFGYATVSPIDGYPTGAKGRVTGGVQNVFFDWKIDDYCISTFCS